MVDVMSADKRSALMSKIRGTNTEPEMQIRSLLWRAGFRFRLHARDLPGKPDIVLKRWRAVVFVHGCFWHHHDGCALFRLPATRTDFWALKLRGNRQRDITAIRALVAIGWRVAVVWECALKHDASVTAAHLAAWIRSNSATVEILRRGNRVKLTKLSKSP